jgi:hypothetical protein
MTGKMGLRSHNGLIITRYYLINILLKSDYILNIKQFEAVRLGNWYQDFFSISFLFDIYSNIGYLTLGVKNQEKQITKIEIRSLGKPNKQKQYSEFKLTFPQDITKNSDFDFNFFINDILDLFNRNKLNYKFELVNIVKDKHLEQYAIIKGITPYSFSELERVFFSLKEINYDIKDFWLKNV